MIFFYLAYNDLSPMTYSINWPITVRFAVPEITSSRRAGCSKNPSDYSDTKIARTSFSRIVFRKWRQMLRPY